LHTGVALLHIAIWTLDAIPAVVIIGQHVALRVASAVSEAGRLADLNAVEALMSEALRTYDTVALVKGK